MHFIQGFFLMVVVTANRNSIIDQMENKAKNNKTGQNEVSIFKIKATDNLSENFQKIVNKDKQSIKIFF